MRPIDADALTEFLKCLLPERGMWEIEGDTGKNAVCETVAEAIEMVKNMETIHPVETDTNVGDTISRQQAIDALDCINGTEEVLRSLPSAQPEDYTELKREFLRMASYIDVLLECSDVQKETLIGFISRLAEFMPWTERD